MISKDKCDYAMLQEVSTQTQEKKVEIMYEEYEAAIQNGVEIMSCGRICAIGQGAQRLLQCQMKSTTVVMDAQSVDTLHNDSIRPMSEEDAQKGLAALANKVIKKGPNAFLNKMATISDVSAAFQDDNLDIEVSTVTASVLDNKISTGLRRIVASLKYSSSSEPPITPALIHTTYHSWKQQKHILPILITSRSLFLVVIDDVGNIRNGSQQDEIVLEDLYRCIACIMCALLYKANELYKKLQMKGLTDKSANRYLCPYPKLIVVVPHTSDKQHTEIQSKLENVKKWISDYYPDSFQHNFKAMVLNASGQSAADIQSETTKFIKSDLNIPTPLSWELFRQMFSYVTKNVPIIQLEKAAAIASLCNIGTKEFPSVLNFYHEHGAFLYYADVEYLHNIIIIDPKWLQEELNKIFPSVDQSSLPMWEWLTKHGILVAPLCEALWHSEDVENLPTGMVKLLEKYHLAAPIDIDQETSDYPGPKYFVPFVLKPKEFGPKPRKMADGLHTAPLHFIFPKIKHLPPGVFTNLIVALASKNIGSFKIDFNSEMCCNQIAYWFGNGMRDKVVLSANLTSIRVYVERSKYCGNEYRALNFWSICRDIFSMLMIKIEAVLNESFKYIETKPAFFCTCKSSQAGVPHYVHINTHTLSTCNTLRCEKDSEYTLNCEEQLWLKMAASNKEGMLLDSEIDGLAGSLQPENQVKLTQALEIMSIGSGTDFAHLISQWAYDTGTEACRAHLAYHLNRLDLPEAAYRINTGGHKKESERLYQCSCK